MKSRTQIIDEVIQCSAPLSHSIIVLIQMTGQPKNLQNSYVVSAHTSIVWLTWRCVSKAIVSSFSRHHQTAVWLLATCPEIPLVCSDRYPNTPFMYAAVAWLHNLSEMSEITCFGWQRYYSAPLKEMSSDACGSNVQRCRLPLIKPHLPLWSVPVGGSIQLTKWIWNPASSHG